MHNTVRELETHETPRRKWVAQIREALVKARYRRTDRQIRRILKDLGK